MKVFLILLFLAGCAGRPIPYTLPPHVEKQMEEIYAPWKEKGFCVCPVHGIYNVQAGSLFFSPMPICGSGAIVFHSHPVIGERGANFLDWHVWKIYQSRYGHDLYGVLLSGGEYKIYQMGD